MIYLNEGMTGGETRFFGDMEQAFLQQRPYLSVKPKKGMALAFLHSIQSGTRVLSCTADKSMCCAPM